jgi:hypothetical protein
LSILVLISALIYNIIKIYKNNKPNKWSWNGRFEWSGDTLVSPLLIYRNMYYTLVYIV